MRARMYYQLDYGGRCSCNATSDHVLLVLMLILSRDLTYRPASQRGIGGHWGSAFITQQRMMAAEREIPDGTFTGVGHEGGGDGGDDDKNDGDDSNDDGEKHLKSAS